MTTEKLRDVIQAQPFQPFNINLADGRVFFVPHPEFIAVTGKGRLIAVGDSQSKNLEIIDLLLVTSLTVVEDEQAA